MTRKALHPKPDVHCPSCGREIQPVILRGRFDRGQLRLDVAFTHACPPEDDGEPMPEAA